MNRAELKQLIRESYREVLAEGKMDGVYVEYDPETKTRILHLPEDMSGDGLKAWLDKNKTALNKKYPIVKKSK